MHCIKTNIDSVWILESPAIKDHRGGFSRLFCNDKLHSIIGKRSIVQINHSITNKIGAIRGMHYQNQPNQEMKIVRCLKGKVFDVAVDLRENSPSFLKWTSCELTPENNRAFIIPEGFAHGFQVLEPDSQLLYLHTAFYNPASEGGIRFDDPSIQITWPLKPCDLSERDQKHPYLKENFNGVPT